MAGERGGVMSAGAAPAPAGPRLVVFTDLDDTLFQTARKLAPGALAEARLAAVAANGSHSFMTPAQQGLLRLLSTGLTVPVTARGSEAFARVELAFSGPSILANGAVILDAEGRACPVWRRRTAAALAAFRPALDRLLADVPAVAAAIGVGVRAWLVEEEGLGGVYAVVKVEPGFDEADLGRLAPDLSRRLTLGGQAGWRTHRNGNNLAFVPPAFSKAQAVAHVMAGLGREGPMLTIGVGDSASDLEFMRLCDVWMTPAGSQIDLGLAALPEAPEADRDARPLAAARP